VDEQVDVAGPARGVRDRRAIRDVQLERRADRHRRRLARRRVHLGRTGVEQRPRESEPEPAVGARDERDAAFDPHANLTFDLQATTLADKLAKCKQPGARPARRPARSILPATAGRSSSCATSCAAATPTASSPAPTKASLPTSWPTA